jgi:hypothetical protein
MGSSDYLDYLDAGQTPPSGCENWVSPFVQEIFDNVLKKYRPDLAELVKNNSQMELI